MTDVEVEMVEILDRPVNIGEWQEWLHRHGVDPDTVIIPGWVVREVTRYRVSWLAFVSDENGRPCWDEDARCYRTAPCHVQLEGPPLPFPPWVARDDAP